MSDIPSSIPTLPPTTPQNVNSNSSDLLDPNNYNFVSFILIIIAILVLANIAAVIICLRYSNKKHKKAKKDEKPHRKKLSVSVIKSTSVVKEEMMHKRSANVSSNDLLSYATANSISKQKKTSIKFSTPSIPLNMSMNYRQNTDSCFELTNTPDLPLSPKQDYIESLTNIKQAIMDDEKASQPFYKNTYDLQPTYDSVGLQDSVKLQQMIFPDERADTETFDGKDGYLEGHRIKNDSVSIHSTIHSLKRINNTGLCHVPSSSVPSHDKSGIARIRNMPCNDSFAVQKDYLMVDESTKRSNTSSNVIKVLSLPSMITSDTEEESDLSLELFSSAVNTDTNVNTNTTLNVDDDDDSESNSVIIIIGEHDNYMGENESLPSSVDESSEYIHPIVSKMVLSNVYSDSLNISHSVARNNKSFGETTNLLMQTYDDVQSGKVSSGDFDDNIVDLLSSQISPINAQVL